MYSEKNNIFKIYRSINSEHVLFVLSDIIYERNKNNEIYKIYTNDQGIESVKKAI
jgi:hypothetical protein